jgi:hypothetical protein
MSTLMRRRRNFCSPGDAGAVPVRPEVWVESFMRKHPYAIIFIAAVAISVGISSTFYFLLLVCSQRPHDGL